MRAKKIVAIVVTAIACLMILFSGTIKLMHNADAVKTLTDFGVGDYITILGSMEIIFTILFIYPKTMKLGFILLSCYFAGAMGTDLSHRKGILNPLLPIALVWVAAFLRDRYIFLPGNESVVNK